MNSLKLRASAFGGITVVHVLWDYRRQQTGHDGTINGVCCHRYCGQRRFSEVAGRWLGLSGRPVSTCVGMCPGAGQRNTVPFQVLAGTITDDQFDWLGRRRSVLRARPRAVCSSSIVGHLVRCPCRAQSSRAPVGSGAEAGRDGGNSLRKQFGSLMCERRRGRPPVQPSDLHLAFRTVPEWVDIDPFMAPMYFNAVCCVSR
eukprot:505467-Pleurochrysis_carterae.AAC.1